MSPSFLQQLLGRLRQEPRALAVYVDSRLTAPGIGEVDEVALHLAVEGSFAQEVGAWAAALPDLVYSGAEPHGWTLITADGVEWRLCLHGPGAEFGGGGTQPVFDRRTGRPAAAPTAESRQAAAVRSGPPDLAAVAGAFWRDLYRAGRAIRAERPLTAHHWLFACGGHLIDLYRLALEPDSGERGWIDADTVPGLLSSVEPVREFLSAPLEGRAQRRAAHRLAEAFEGLVLPLFRRIGLDYPMALRTLAFASLEADRAAGGAKAATHSPEAPDAGAGTGSASGTKV